MIKFTNYLEIFEINTGAYFFNKLNRSIVFMDKNNYKCDGDVYYYYCGNEKKDFEFLSEYDFFLSDENVKDIIIQNSTRLNSLKYILSLTNNCNLKCDYCYQSWKTANCVMTKNTLDMFLIKLYNDLNVYPEIKDVFIDFFGGEPTLEKEIIYYTLEKLKTIALEKGINFHYGLDTNGLLLTQDFIKHFKNLTVSVTLSQKKDHNTHRGDGTGRDFFSKIITNLNSCKYIFNTDDNFTLLFRYNTHHNNIKQFEKFVKFIKKLDVNCSIDAENVGNYQGSTFKNKLSELDFKIWKATDYVDILKKNNFDVDELPDISLDRKCFAASQPASCKIWADGCIGVCDFENFSERKYITSYENLTPKKTYDILNKKRFELPRMCLDCYDYPYCGGIKICFNCDGVYKYKNVERLKINRYLMYNNKLIT